MICYSFWLLRCKLCGQLKQNHNCPYQQSLQRSIGVMVQPAVNAFTAREPGMLTKSLSEMNNFVSYDHNSLETDHPRRVNIQSVTPETNKTRLLHSPESSLSTHSVDPSPPGADWSNDRKRSHVHVSTDVPEPTIRLKKQPFVEPLALRSEQYRAVTPKPKTKELVNANDFHYPPVPLTFKERKRLTDTLFCLSQGVPSMMRDVAALLRPARKKEEWDLAVAEVLTQVVVGVYCTEGDHRLDGLQHFLLGIGISC